MIVEVWDQEGRSRTVRISTQEELLEFFGTFPEREPFFCEFVEHGHKLGVCIRVEFGCVQHSRTDNAPPYMMAVSNDQRDQDEEVDFLVGNEATGISARYCLSLETTKQIVTYFLETGERSPAAAWEEI